jgi:hypothetical protein
VSELHELITAGQCYSEVLYKHGLQGWLTDISERFVADVPLEKQLRLYLQQDSLPILNAQ